MAKEETKLVLFLKSIQNIRTLQRILLPEGGCLSRPSG